MAENGQLAEEYHPQQTPSHSLSPPLSPSHCKCVINKKLLPIKGYYFMFLAAVGDLLPFIGIYMKHLGLTSEETGVIYGVMPFIGFFIRPVIGAVSDKYKKHKLVLVLITALTGLFYLLLTFVPNRAAPAIHTNFACNTQDSYFQDCSDLKNPTKCPSRLTDFINSPEVTNLSKSFPCSFTCKTELDSEIIQACFTNSTGGYSEDNCIDTNDNTTLSFIIPDFKKLISSEIIKDKTQDSSLCRSFDVKDIHINNGSAIEVLQILCAKEFLLNCSSNCPQTMLCSKSSHFHLDATFFLFFIIFLSANIAFAPIFPILDAAAYEILGEERHLWGKQRLWGTFGFALFAVTSTFTMYWQRELGRKVDYHTLFYMFVPLCAMSAIIASFITMSTDIKCGQFIKNIWRLLSCLEVSAFLFVVMYFGILTGALETFLFWFLESHGSSPLVFGFILLVDSCSEVPILWIAGAVIKKIGLVSCLYLALVCYGIRMIVFSLIYEPWLVLLVEPLYGVCFALMYAAASSYASIIAPPGMAATVQGLLAGVHFGFGKGLGSIITGFMFTGIGDRWTWRVYAILSAIVLVAYASLNKFVFKPDHHPQCATQPSTSVNPGDQANQEENLINSNSHTHLP